MPFAFGKFHDQILTDFARTGRESYVNNLVHT